MDFYAGSQPRSFVSFLLGENSNGQPTQPNEEMMDTSQQNADVEEQSSDRTENEIEVIEITLSSSEPEYSPREQPEQEVTTPERLGVAQIKREAVSISLLAKIYKRGGSVFASR